MQQKSVADVIVKRLTARGVERVFGYGGDGINGVVEALNRAGNMPAIIQARHDENAAFMAVGHAKFTGGVGVVLSTQGRVARQAAGVDRVRCGVSGSFCIEVRVRVPVGDVNRRVGQDRRPHQADRSIHRGEYLCGRDVFRSCGDPRCPVSGDVGELCGGGSSADNAHYVNKLFPRPPLRDQSSRSA